MRRPLRSPSPRAASTRPVGRRAERVDVRRIGAAHGREHERSVHDGARRRCDVAHVAEGIGRHVVRHEAERLLEADDAAAGRRNARRAASIRADCERADADRSGRRCAARGAAAGAAGVVGVAGSAEQRRLGERHVAELRRRRLAHQDRAGGFQARDRHGVGCGNVVLVHERREGRAHALGVDEVLHVQRYAVERPEIIAARDGLVGGFRIAQRLVGADGDEAVECGLRLLGARECGLHDLDRGRLAVTNQGGDFGGAEPGKVIGHVRTLFSLVWASVLCHSIRRSASASNARELDGRAFSGAAAG